MWCWSCTILQRFHNWNFIFDCTLVLVRIFQGISTISEIYQNFSHFFFFRATRGNFLLNCAMLWKVSAFPSPPPPSFFACVARNLAATRMIECHVSLLTNVVESVWPSEDIDAEGLVRAVWSILQFKWVSLERLH